tara:strand:- start:426 stop:935 length:510 start_codon:yes stop_codon:yes gene_type:complete
MKNIFRILSFFIILLTACENKERNLFWISEPNGQENDFLFMAESTNIPEIESDSLMLYLTKEEIFSAEKLTFKNFGKIHSDQRFDVHILLKEGSDTGRNYTFIIRTFDSNFKIIDSYELASWIDSINLRCYGSIDENLIINRSCENGINNDVRQIINDGRIVATSFHKP